MNPSLGPVSRRGMIALASLLVMSGCAESFDDQVAKDPYISLIKKDPMFAWVPPGNLHREVNYTPMATGPESSQSSTVLIVYSVEDSDTIPALIKLARDASRSNGYTEAGKRDAGGGVTVLLNIQATSGNQGFSLILRAPVN